MSEYVHDRVRIVNITDPTNISTVTTISDGTSFPGLDGAYGVHVVEIGGTPYLLVASYFENALQIIDVSDPSNPSSVSVVRHNGNDLILTTGF